MLIAIFYTKKLFVTLQFRLYFTHSHPANLDYILLTPT